MKTHFITFTFLLLITLFLHSKQATHFKYEYIKSTYEYYMNKLSYKLYLLLDNYSSYSFTISLQEIHTRIASIPPSNKTINHGTYSISVNDVNDISSYLYEIPCTLFEPPSVIEDDVDITTFNLFAYQLRGYEHNIGIDFVLSLSLESKPNKDLSFIERLHIAKLVQHKVVTFEAYNNNNKEWGYMYIGNYNYDSNKYLHKATCSSHSSYWGVKLNSFAYVDSTSNKIINLFKSNESIYLKIVSGVYDIIVPRNYYYKIHDALFVDYYLKGYCYYTKEKGTQCDCEDIKTFPSVLLSVDKYTFNLTSGVLFREKDNRCEFLIKYKEDNDNEWLLGNGLWLKMNTKFDYDNKEITFYSNDIGIYDRVITGEDNHSKNKYILCLNIIITLICICGIICEIYIKLK